MILKVTALPGADFDAFAEEWRNNPILQKFDAKESLETGLDTAAIQELLIERGQTDILREEAVNEHLTTPGTSQAKLISILQRYINKMAPDSELIIVDPYFYPRNFPAGYSQFIADILTPYLAGLNEIKVVTSTNYNAVIRAQVETDLKARRPGLIISHTTTDNYHDRFWISNGREQGLIVGTSLNGLGNKYALVDRLNKSDVREIVASLAAESLI